MKLYGERTPLYAISLRHLLTLTYLVCINWVAKIGCEPSPSVRKSTSTQRSSVAERGGRHVLTERYLVLVVRDEDCASQGSFSTGKYRAQYNTLESI